MTVFVKKHEERRCRPAIHFTPQQGFMNDPNGLVYSKGIWHLYYQLDNRSLVADHAEWGHATSTDLLSWRWHKKAIEAPSDHESVWSGCCVIDRNNTSFQFDESSSPDDRIVALYTLRTEGHQTQNVAVSSDGGYTFTPYKHNPVLDIGSADFRDPKVLWHAPSNQWVMVIAICREFKVGFYGSPDLIHWHHLSDFEGSGVRGYQYEMPNLVEVSFDNDHQRKKWVLFLSIGPGAPLGGSFTQYFLGEFDGTRFTSDDNYLRTADLGKDWYAAQTWFDSPDDTAYGIGWASNWQYCNQVPAEGYRSAMSLPRKFTVRQVPLNTTTKSLSLISRPIDLEKVRLPNDDDMAMVYTNGSTKAYPSTQVIYKKQLQGSGSFEFKLKISSETPAARATVDIANPSGRSIGIDFLVEVEGMYISLARGGIRTGSSWDHPLFDDKVCMWIPNTQPVYDVHVIIDAYVCELFAMDGAYAFTNTFFLEGGAVSTFKVSQDSPVTEVFDVYELCAIK
ncbi:hypothetical protein B0A52_01721 [Exophiala mesophila]|uniref:Glycosyl hydrolase family 32 N-terminal domain-containing protein n=1 Tax=Exophiala mesophila TaxID=212818 RepID=A0A438NFU6_EXOME|nr:hypothetical protein B0A52_01721 [Exophiala mesophila]